MLHAEQKRELYIPYISVKRVFYDTKFEGRVRNEMTQRAIAKKYVDGIRAKARFEANMCGEQILRFMTIATADKRNGYVPLGGFTTAGLPRPSHFFVL